MPNFVRATVFIFFLGLGPICDEFRIWALNLVCLYFIESLSRFGTNCLFCVYFVFNCHLSLNVVYVFNIVLSLSRVYFVFHDMFRINLMFILY